MTQLVASCKKIVDITAAVIGDLAKLIHQRSSSSSLSSTESETREDDLKTKSETSEDDLKCDSQKFKDVHCHEFSWLRESAEANRSMRIFLQRIMEDPAVSAVKSKHSQLNGIMSMAKRHECQLRVLEQRLEELARFFSDATHTADLTQQSVQEVSENVSALREEVKRMLNSCSTAYCEKPQSVLQPRKTRSCIKTSRDSIGKKHKAIKRKRELVYGSSEGDDERSLSDSDLKRGSSDVCQRLSSTVACQKELQNCKLHFCKDSIDNDNGIPEYGGSTLHTSSRREREQETSTVSCALKPASDTRNMDSLSAGEFKATHDCGKVIQPTEEKLCEHSSLFFVSSFAKSEDLAMEQQSRCGVHECVCPNCRYKLNVEKETVCNLSTEDEVPQEAQLSRTHLQCKMKESGITEFEHHSDSVLPTNENSNKTSQLVQTKAVAIPSQDEDITLPVVNGLGIDYKPSSYVYQCKADATLCFKKSVTQPLEIDLYVGKEGIPVAPVPDRNIPCHQKVQVRHEANINYAGLNCDIGKIYVISTIYSCFKKNGDDDSYSNDCNDSRWLKSRMPHKEKAKPDGKKPELPDSRLNLCSATRDFNRQVQAARKQEAVKATKSTHSDVSSTGRNADKKKGLSDAQLNMALPGCRTAVSLDSTTDNVDTNQSEPTIGSNKLNSSFSSLSALLFGHEALTSDDLRKACYAQTDEERRIVSLFEFHQERSTGGRNETTQCHSSTSTSSVSEMCLDVTEIRQFTYAAMQIATDDFISCPRLEDDPFPQCLEVEQSNHYQVQDKWYNYLHQARCSCENVQGQSNICNGFQHLQSTLLFDIGTNTNAHFSVPPTQILEAYHTLFAIEKYLKDKFMLPFDDFRQGSDRKKGSIPSDNFRFKEKKCHNSPSAEGSRGSYKPRGLQDNRGIEKTKQETSQFMKKSHEETIEGERQISFSIDELRVITEKQFLQRSTDQSRTQTEKLTDECYVVSSLPHDNVDEQPITAVSEMESHDTSKLTHQSDENQETYQPVQQTHEDTVEKVGMEMPPSTADFKVLAEDQQFQQSGDGPCKEAARQMLTEGQSAVVKLGLFKGKDHNSNDIALHGFSKCYPDSLQETARVHTLKLADQKGGFGTRADKLDNYVIDEGRIISYEELRRGTRDFDSRSVDKGGCKIDAGSSADVYHAQLRDAHGTMYDVAVKKLKQLKSGKLSKQQFLTELKALEKYHHFKIVRLIGHCSEPEPCLVYEYMPGRNLAQNLAKDNPNSLMWSFRVKILCDVSCALDHLHTSYNPALVHRDVKSASILLTENFEGKLADFGLAMPTESENPMASFYVERAAGTKAYMPPEAFKGKVSPRLDIFSFGVVTYEVVTGSPAYCTATREDLVTKMRDLERQKSNLLHVADCRAKWPSDVASQLYQCAKECTDFDSHRRPPMAKLFTMLESLIDDHHIS